ncbi:MAG: hypothetical protein AABZ15_09945 [Nitrospirota bacterium]
MNRIFIIPVLLICSVFLFSCSPVDFNGLGAGGGTTTTSTATLVPASITTSADGAVSVAMVLQSKELLTTSTNLFKNLGFIAQSNMVSAASGTGTGTCTDYGTYDYTRSYSGGSYVLIYSFKLCRENDFQYDGTYVAMGTPASFTGRLSGLTILNFKNNYTTLIGSLVGTSVSYVMTGSGDAANALYIFTANGGISGFDYYTLGQHDMMFTALVTNYTVSTDAGNTVRDTAMTTNGRYSVRRLAATTAITYVGFTVNTQKQLLTNIEDVTIGGRISADRTPTAGFEGVFDIATPTPIRTVLVPYPPKTTQGTVVTNSSATVQYGNPDSIIVSVGTDTPQAFAKEFMLLKQADFYAMEQQLPIVSGATGTATGTVMSLSALSSGPSSAALDCYTDVHVSYFLSTAPTATIPNWYVHWDSNLNTCAAQAGIPFQEATSSTGIATDPCDVGLDINGASKDIASGGVEHFLAAALPQGYYVLSINNYSCATATIGNAATVMIGDYLFGPYTCSYTALDGDNFTPGAWCRLADVRVNASGVIDVLAPNGAIPPWHP